MWKASEGLFLIRTCAILKHKEGHLDASAETYATWIVRGRSLEATTGLERMVARIRGVHSIVEMDSFEKRTDKSSSDLYFYYYGMLQHQQNMLQDHIRTGTYFAAITENPVDFEGKVVMDVGCGSGILSFFAVQAGARKVYAVEASNMARFAEQLVRSNPSMGSKIHVIQGKVEEIVLPEKVDVLVSEPMGTLLVNERMLETYFYARDHHLWPGGKMFPGTGTIYISAFSDEQLYCEILSKSMFWQHDNFYGVDLSSLQADSKNSYFSQVVVDQILPNVLVSNSVMHKIDFSTCGAEELLDFEIPLSLQVGKPCTVHGIASWFDVSFDGTTSPRILSTSPGMPVTHWFQLRCVLKDPIQVYNPGETIKGVFRLKAHARQSYDLTLEMSGPPHPQTPWAEPQFSSGEFDLKEPYYRQLVHPAWDKSNTASENNPDFHTLGFQSQNMATTSDTKRYIV